MNASIGKSEINFKYLRLTHSVHSDIDYYTNVHCYSYQVNT